jgi:hypothetical protein
MIPSENQLGAERGKSRGTDVVSRYRPTYTPLLSNNQNRPVKIYPNSYSFSRNALVFDERIKLARAISKKVKTDEVFFFWPTRLATYYIRMIT